MTSEEDSIANVEQFAATARLYDDCRPRPPDDLVRLLASLCHAERPALVVDLGCGTGLSTRIWAGRAGRVIGIEPGAAMRSVAEARTADAAIEYRPGYGNATGLADSAADVVTVSQAFHWMEPESTLAEAARILRPGGVFATVDCRWPVTVHWEAELAEIAVLERIRRLREARPEGFPGLERWPKDGHLAWIRRCGRFRFAKAVALHHVEQGDARRFEGLLMSQGHVQNALRAGLTEEEIGLPRFRAEVRRTLGDRKWPWHVSYDVRYGIR